MLKTKVREIRKSMNLTQEEFAKKLGVSRSTVKDLETGANKCGNLKLLNKLCEVSGKSSSYFLENGAEIKLNHFEVLNSAIDKLIEADRINDDGSIKDKESERLVLEILKAEIKLKKERQAK